MASKSAQHEPERAEVIEEALDNLDRALDRVKVLYEQYFLGIQKQPPTFIHTDVERKLRDLAQMHVRNTGQRYRLATLQQKFGSYNNYWRRTLRQIENGTYHRNLSKISRRAARSGEEIPEEILAAMPKRMREQVRRDREAALTLARLRGQADGGGQDAELAPLPDGGGDDEPGLIRESTELRRKALAGAGMHVIDEADMDFDLDAFFAEVEQETPATAPTQPIGRIGAAAGAAALEPTQPIGRIGAAAGAAALGPTQPIGRIGAAAGAAAQGPTQPIRRADAAAGMRGSVAAEGGGSPDMAPAGAVDGGAGEQGAMPLGGRGGASAGAARASGSTSSTGERPSARRIDVATGPTQPIDRVAAASGAGVAPGEPGAKPPATGAIPSVGRPAAMGGMSGPATGRITPPPGATSGPATGRITPPPPPGSTSGPATGRISPPPPMPGPATGRITPPPPMSGPATGRITPPPPPTSGQPTARIAPPPVPGAPPRPPGAPPPRPAEGAGPTVTSAIRSILPPTSPIPRPAPMAPSQTSRPNPIIPGSSIDHPSVPVESMSGPFPREPAAPPARPTPKPRAATEAGTGVARPPSQRPTAIPVQRDATAPRVGPPPGMTDEDVNALYSKYVKAKQMVGEDAGPGAYGKLLKTINAQAPKIMEQYQAKGVDFSVVVKDNQVIIKAKPKP